MKKYLLRVVCLALAFAMLFTLPSCKESNTSSAAESGGYYDVDVDGSGDGTNDNQSGNDSNTSSDPVKTPSDGGTPQTVSGDLSWNQLLATIPAKLKGTTVKVYSWNPAKEVTGAEEVISKFEKQTGMKVKWITGSYDNYDSNIAALINSGDSPDIIRHYSPYIHRIAMCQDMSKATGFDFKSGVWDQQVVNAYTFKGKIYGVNLTNTLIQQPAVMVYNKSVVKRLKLSDPYTMWKQGKWNWDSFIELCKDFKDETGNPGWMTYCHLDYYRFCNQNFIGFDGKKFYNNLSDSGLLSSVQKMADYRTSDITDKAMRNRDNIENGVNLFYDDNIIAARRTQIFYNKIKGSNNYGCVPVPEIPGKTYYQEYRELEAYGIPKGSKNPIGAAYFLRFYLDAANYDEKMFFTNEQALEVYKWCRNQKNIYCALDTQLIQNDYEGMTAFIMHGGSAAQVKSEFDKFAQKLNPIVDRANDALNKLD